MPTYSYTKLADYILDQLWGFASVNSLKNSLRYIGEDILGDPSANSDKIPALNFDNGATHGGRLNFNGGTTSYVGSDATGLIFQVEGFTSASANAGNIIWEAYTRSTGTTVGKRGVAISNSSVSFSTSSTSFVDVTNLSTGITTSGKPVFIGLMHEGGTATNTVGNGGGTAGFIQADIKFMRDTTDLAVIQMIGPTSVTVGTGLPGSAYSFIDTPAAGAYVYKVQARIGASSQPFTVGRVKLFTFEL